MRKKFRIWNGKKWIHGPGNEVDLFGENVLFGGLLRDTSLEDLNSCVALQSINLLDDFGKEIYEGDIVEFDDSEISLKPAIGTAQVIFCNDLTLSDSPCFGLWFIGEKRGFSKSMLGKIKVIGNIYDTKIPPAM